MLNNKLKVFHINEIPNKATMKKNKSKLHLQINQKVVLEKDIKMLSSALNRYGFTTIEFNECVFNFNKNNSLSLGSARNIIYSDCEFKDEFSPFVFPKSKYIEKIILFGTGKLSSKDSIFTLEDVKHLEIKHSKFSFSINNHLDLSNMKNLNTFKIERSDVSGIIFDNLNVLNNIKLIDCYIPEIYINADTCYNLYFIDAINCGLKKLSFISDKNISNLSTIDLSGNNLCYIPTSILNLKKLTEIYLNRNEMLKLEMNAEDVDVSLKERFDLGIDSINVLESKLELMLKLVDNLIITDNCHVRNTHHEELLSDIEEQVALGINVNANKKLLKKIGW